MFFVFLFEAIKIYNILTLRRCMVSYSYQFKRNRIREALMHNNVVENVIATIIVGALSTALGIILRAFGFSSQESINAGLFALLVLAILFLVGKRFYPGFKRTLTVKLLEQVLNISPNNVDEVTFKNQIVNRVLLENPRVEPKGSDSILEFPNQKACESRIRDACAKAKKVKILTIRGEQYFQGTRSLLRDLCLEKRGKGFSIEVLVLSPESQHITEELAESLGHSSAGRTKKRMHNVLDNLKHMEEENENFLVKCYEITPIFKLLFFDDVLFVSAIIGPKNDYNAKMYQITREEGTLFSGFERYFDEL